jgi:hypothetical protein
MSAGQRRAFFAAPGGQPIRRTAYFSLTGSDQHGPDEAKQGWQVNAEALSDTQIAVAQEGTSAEICAHRRVRSLGLNSRPKNHRQFGQLSYCW